MRKKAYTLSPELEQERYSPRYPAWTVLTFFAVMLAGTVLAFLLFLRPSYSAEEKRELAAFPSFSAASLADGSYFRGIDRWFSDTFPLREGMVSANARMKSLYGIHRTAIYNDGNDPFDNDEIPEPPATSAPAVESSTVSTGTTDTTVPPTTASTTATPTTTPPTTVAPSADTTEPTVPENPNAPVQQMGSVLVVGNAAYEYYNFSQASADLYVSAVNRAADRLAGRATVYDILVPLAMDITLPDTVRAQVNSADQKKAIDYIYGSFSQNVRAVDAYTALRRHRNEYLYFRTDHHWTATGAYYAYAAFCGVRGITPPALSDYRTLNFEGYLGSFYSTTGKAAALGNSPDTVTAYLPLADTTMQFTDRNGKTTNWAVVKDVSGWNSSSYYNTFIGGDNPFTVIHSSAKTDGSSCVVVKESFGNAFVPFLTSDYETIYVIDYRYYKGELVDFVTQNGVQDVIFINNMSASRSSSLMKSLDGLIGNG